MRKIDGVGRLVQVGVRDLGQGERKMVESFEGRIVTFFDDDLARGNTYRKRLLIR